MTIQYAHETMLYFKTSENIEYPLLIKYVSHTHHSKQSLPRFLNDLALTSQKELRTQKNLSIQLLNTYHLSPFYLNTKLILCPMQPQRAPVQIYINMVQVIAASSYFEQTKVHFEHNITLIVPIPLIQFIKKWKDAMMLSKLL